MIYSSPSYVLGSTEPSPEQAKTALRSMQRSLKGWLKYRRIMDEAAAGVRKPPGQLQRPRREAMSPGMLQATLYQERFRIEQSLADDLHRLLTECGVSPLPKPSVKDDPDVAVKLAELAIKGECPGETSGPQAQGILWFVIAIPALAIVMVISSIIKNKAEVAKEEARIRCIEAGHCTDSGFWMKAAAVGVLGWLAWEKFGLKKKLA